MLSGDGFASLTWEHIRSAKPCLDNAGLGPGYSTPKPWSKADRQIPALPELPNSHACLHCQRQTDTRLVERLYSPPNKSTVYVLVPGSTGGMQVTKASLPHSQASASLADMLSYLQSSWLASIWKGQHRAMQLTRASDTAATDYWPITDL